MAITPAMITKVSQFYVALFGRAPDGAPLAAPQQDGLSYWTQELSNGITLPTVANQMFNTVEARPYYPLFYNNDQIVHSFYLNVLGRDDAADPVGHAYWLAALNAPGANAGTVIYQMIVATTSYVPGSISDTAINAAAIVAQNLFNNRATVAEYYGMHQGNIAGATAALAGVTDNSASIATAEAAIDTYIANQTVVTLLLTANMDTGAPFTGHGTFIAGDIAGVSTWTAGDSVTGTGLNNVFTVTSATALANPAATSVTGIQTANLTSGLTGSVLDTSAWTGLTQFNDTGTGAMTAKSAATTAIAVNDPTQGANPIIVNGGSTVTVTATNAVTGGSIAIGGTTAPAGAVLVNLTENGSANLTGDTVTVTGGTTVTVNETLVQSALGATTTGNTVTVNGKATTTAVTVTQTAASAAQTANANESAAILFAPAGLTAGQTLTIGGLTFTSTGITTQAQLAIAFSSLANGATSGLGTTQGIYSGTFTGWTTSTVSGTTVTASSTTPAVDVTNLTASGTGIAPKITTTAGSTVNTVAVITNGSVNISDLNAGSLSAAATITDVTLTNYGASTISSNALANLTLTGSSGTVGLTEGLAVPTNTTLTLHVNTVNNNVTDSSNQFKTVNIVTSGTSGFNIGSTGLTTVAISGTGDLSTSFAANTALTSITDSTTGISTLTLNPGVSFAATGAGQDIITVNGVTNANLAAGSGTSDTLNAAFTGTGTTSFGGTVSGFETIGFTSASGGSFDFSKFAGATGIKASGAITVSVNKVTAGTALAFSGTTTGTSFTYQVADSAGAGDTVPITMGSSTSQGLTQTTLNMMDASNNAIGNVTLAASALAGGYTHTITNLDSTLALGAAGTTTGGGISSLTITGNAAVAIGAGTFNDNSQTLSIINNSSSPVGSTITVSDNNLQSLAISGTNAPIASATVTGNTVNLTSAWTGSFSISDSGSAALTMPGTNITAIVGLTVLDTSAAPMSITGTLTAPLTSTTLTNNGGALLTVNNLADTGASSTLTANGSGATTLTTYAPSGATAHTITNSGSGILTISTLTETGATALALNNSGTGTLSVTGASTAGGTVTMAGAMTLVDTQGAAMTAVLGAGVQLVTIGAGADIVKFTFGDSGAVSGFAASTAFPTSGAINVASSDIISGFRAGDQLTNTNGTLAAPLKASGGTFGIDTAGNQALINGTYSSSAHTFTPGAGADSLYVYDNNGIATGGSYEAIVLVGYQDAGTTDAGFTTGLLGIA